MLVALSFVDPFFFLAVALLSIGSAGIGIGIPLGGYVPGGGGGPGAGVDNLLLETGDDLLLETGDAILLE